jgi:flagellar motor switch protein FliG
MSARIVKILLLFALFGVLAPGLPGVGWAQQQGAQLIDSLEEHQKRLDELIRERLKSVVPSGNFILRIFVVGKIVQVPRPIRAGEAADLPGFRRNAALPQRSVEKFRVDQVNVRIVVNEDIAPSEVEYIRTIVPLLAEFREDRADQLDLQVVPPAERQEDGSVLPPGFDLDMRDWLLLGLLGVILLLLLVVLIRVLITPKPRRMRDPYEPEPYRQPQPPPPPRPATGPAGAESAAAAATAVHGSREEQEANQQVELERQLDSLKHSVVKGLFARNDLGQQLVQSWIDQPNKVGGLVHALGPTISRQALLPHLDRERYQTLEDSVRQDPPPSLENQIDLLREANLFLVAQDLAHPEEIRPDPFSFLVNLSRGQVAHLVSDEPVRIKAIVLSRIDPRDTAQILDGMAKDMQLEVAVQIGNFQSMPLDMAENVARDLAVKARNLPDAKTVDIQGTQKLVDLMARTSHGTSRYLLDAIKSKDTKLSEAVERRFFMFDAIPLVPQDVLPQVVRALPSSTIIQALQGADPEIQRMVIMAFPEQARTGLVTTLRASQYDEDTVMEARQQVVSGFQSLAEQGKIDLSKITEAFQAKAS